jgi:DNA-binding Lrp family transcriptional regulator
MQAVRKSENGKVERYCSKCSEKSVKVIELVEDTKFLERLKNNFRAGRAEKPLRSLSRSLNVSELDLHEILKFLDDKGNLAYGYYDKIEKMYVRTHLTEDIDPELLVDMIYQSYAYDIFGAKGLTNYISLGRQTSVRKVIQSLHELRKKERIRGYKKGARWLWRLPKPEEDKNTPFFPPKKIKEEIQKEEEEEETEETEEEDIVYDDEEEDGGVYFADPENDDD